MIFYRKSGPIMPQEYSNAQIKWICHGQQQVYYEEISNLSTKSTAHLTWFVNFVYFWMTATLLIMVAGYTMFQ